MLVLELLLMVLLVKFLALMVLGIVSDKTRTPFQKGLSVLLVLASGGLVITVLVFYLYG